MNIFKNKYAWISVKEQMPPKEGYYKIKNGKNAVRFDRAYYAADGKFYSSFERYHIKAKCVTVTHWVKLEE